MNAAYVDIKDRLMRSVLLTMGFPYCHGSLYKHIRPTYPGCHRWGGDAGHSPECGWGTGVLRLCPGTLAEGLLYDGLKEICQAWCWLALCQSDVAQLIKVPQRTDCGEPMAIFLV